MRTRILITVVATAALAAMAIAGATAEEAPRTGTFNTRAVALCYGRSDAFRKRIEAMRAEHEQAMEAGDSTRVAELEQWGPALQDTLHRQVFGDAPIWNIIDLLEDDLPAIAERAGVDAIVVPIHGRPGNGLVDITRAMVEPFDPDEQTLAMMEDLMGTEPVEME
ncbi:MAG: hypothetical protein GF405_11080 [Candidatus Eisenbacteria bacterium]|nr:hypothetical protein [Candidatus Eisenbacteria bacterium]